METKTNIKAKLPSRHVTEGPERAPHRSYLYAMGLTTKQIHQPFVGVASCWNEAAPCNISLMRQAQAVKKGVPSAGGTPREFSTLPGNFRGQQVPGEGIVEAVGKHSVGEMSDADLDEIERVACPSAGACGAQFTANTMATVSEAIGLALPYSAGAPAPYEIRDAFCMTAGEKVMDLIASNIRPRDIVTRRALENAAAVVAASGGSTNAALHLPAIAHECGIKFDLFDVAEIFKKTPYIADLKPGGRYVAKDMFEVGGIPLLMKTLLDHGYLHGDCLTVTGRTIAENLKNVKWNPHQDVVRSADKPITVRSDEDIARSRLPSRRLSDRYRPDHRGKPEEREVESASRRGALCRQADHRHRWRGRPEGKSRARRRDCEGRRNVEFEIHRTCPLLRLRGRRVRIGTEKDLQGRGGHRDPLRGPARRPRHAGDALHHRGADRPGHGRQDRAD